jgi:hypothetical protein
MLLRDHNYFCDEKATYLQLLRCLVTVENFIISALLILRKQANPGIFCIVTIVYYLNHVEIDFVPEREHCHEDQSSIVNVVHYSNHVEVYFVPEREHCPEDQSSNAS